MSLRVKLLLPLLVVFLLVSLLFHLSWRPYYLDNERNEIVEREEDVLRNLSYRVEKDLVTGQFDQLYSTLDRVRQINADEDYRIYLFDADGRRLYPAHDLIHPLPQHHVVREQALLDGEVPLGRLRVTVDWSERYQEADQQLRAVELLLLGGFGSALLLISLLQHLLVGRPLARLNAGAQQLAGGDFDCPLPAASRDEIGALMQAFDRMRVSLKQAQSALEQKAVEASHNAIRLATVLKSMPCGLVIVDQNRLVVEVNRTAEELFGRTADQMVGRRSDTVIPGHVLVVEAEVVGSMLAGSRASALEVEFCRDDGRRLQLHLWQALMYLGEQVCTVNIVLDITPLKEVESRLRRAKEEAERANLAKSEFLSRMSHELRTPLNAILGFAQCLELDEQSLNASQLDSVSEILHAGRHLLGLINEVLDLSRIESGRMALVAESVALAPLAEACVSQLRPLATQRQIRLQQELDPTLQVQADPTRMRQVLINLLSNAIKYNRDGGLVRLFAAPVAGQQVRIGVEDNGPGVPEAMVSRLFEPFERGEAQLSVEGTGIGLALVKQLVEAMGGEVGVESGPERGSLFWIQLPRAGARSPEAPPEAETGDAVASEPDQAADSGRHRILYVEDNPANMRLVQQLLERHTALTLIAADDAETGIELARSQRPALILLDINLPGISGFEVLRRLQQDSETRDIPVVAVSASAMARDIERGVDAGFKAYLTKPLDIPLFLETVQQLLPPPAAGADLRH